MATLGDTGSTDVNENNPYQTAMANRPSGQSLALNPQAATAAQLGPASLAYQKAMSNKDSSSSSTPSTPSASSDTGIRSQMTAAFNDTPVPDDSVTNTPEAASASDVVAQRQGVKDQALASTLNVNAKKPKLPTEQQNVNAALAPDQAILSSLPAEYQQSLAALAPYINAGQNTGDPALDAADAEVANVTNQSEGPVESALGGLAKAGKQFESTVPYSGIVQALLGQSKYNITYNSAQPGNKSDWNDTMNDIYSYLSGENASSDGLPTPTTAANSAGTPSTAADTAGGGNA